MVKGLPLSTPFWEFHVLSSGWISKTNAGTAFLLPFGSFLHYVPRTLWIKDVETFLLPFGSFKRRQRDVFITSLKLLKLSTPFWEFR